ncbi:hypothetical protein HF319_08585 [Xanthomonas sp. Kuri4-1]
MSRQANPAPAGRDPDTYPLRFKKHNVQAYCYNTQDCQVVYDNANLSSYATGKPRGAPPAGDYRSHWPFASHVGVGNFPPPAKVTWTSLDGEHHQADVDIAGIFKDERVLHEVPEEQIPEKAFTGPAGEPSIYIEVNDRRISVYMKMLIPTRQAQIPGNPNSFFRDDVIKAWSRTY